MPKKVWIGIDNGVTGSIGWVGSEKGFVKTPNFVEQDYHMSRPKNVTRVDVIKLKHTLKMISNNRDVKVFLERPFSNARMYNASLSAIRAWEATLIVLEQLELNERYLVDSKSWQEDMLPAVAKGIKGKKKSAILKALSAKRGRALFPEFKPMIKEQGDADGLLIAEWAREENL